MVLLGPDGGKLVPDAAGVLLVPVKWEGSIVSVRDAETWLEIHTAVMERVDNAITPLVVR